jgi:hypothetical protein
MTQNEAGGIWPSPALARAPTVAAAVSLFVAANRRGQFRSTQCLEAARHDTLTQHPPTVYWLGVAVCIECAEIAAIEQVADQAPGRPADRHCVRLRRCQQSRGQARDVADNLAVP